MAFMTFVAFVAFVFLCSRRSSGRRWRFVFASKEVLYPSGHFVNHARFVFGLVFAGCGSGRCRCGNCRSRSYKSGGCWRWSSRHSRPDRDRFWCSGRRHRCRSRSRCIRCRLTFVTLIRYNDFWRVGLIAPLPHARFDISHIKPGFVVAHGGVSRSEIDGNAFNTWHFTNPLFDSDNAQYRQHVAY